MPAPDADAGESVQADGGGPDPPDGEPTARPDDPAVLVAGETLVDFVPDSTAPLADVETFDRRAGGAPANVAVALSRLGRPPLFWTRVGADPFGDFLAARLAAEGVPGRFVERDPEAHTTLAFVSRGDAAPRFTFYRDDTADTRLEQGAVPDDALGAVEWVHVGGVALAAEPARTATMDLVERAGEAGATVSFDPNVRPELWANEPELAAVCGWAVEGTDVLIATPREVATLDLVGDSAGTDATDATDPVGPTGVARSADSPDPGDLDSAERRDRALALARRVRERGPHTVVLTLGPAGAVGVAGADTPWAGEATHPGFEVEAVDPTGAGDAFAAGLIDALRRGEPLADALAAANAVGALATTARGAMEALPGPDAVSSLLDR